MYTYQNIKRRYSRTVMVGNVAVGGNAPISVQTMTNTLTTDVQATIKMINRLAEAGADIVRVSCPDYESTTALKEITKVSPVPIVADIHFNYKLAIESAKSGAKCLRINPGNIGDDRAVKEVIKAALDYGCSMRIGVNGGSLEKHILDKYGEPTADGMVESALSHAKILEDNDFFNFKISVKASNYFLAVEAYRKLAKACDYPLHVGITEAGGKRSGTVLSALGIGTLLSEGIGDTIRVSLSTDPEEEIHVGFDILKSLKLRSKGVNIIACPSCARQGFDVPSMVADIENALSHIKEPITLSILGCVVNGLGEAAHSNIGVVGIPKDRANLIMIDGVRDHTVSNENLKEDIIKTVNDYIARKNSV